jgi:hypothetical protein
VIWSVTLAVILALILAANRSEGSACAAIWYGMTHRDVRKLARSPAWSDRMLRPRITQTDSTITDWLAVPVRKVDCP